MRLLAPESTRIKDVEMLSTGSWLCVYEPHTTAGHQCRTAGFETLRLQQSSSTAWVVRLGGAPALVGSHYLYFKDRLVTRMVTHRTPAVSPPPPAGSVSTLDLQHVLYSFYAQLVRFSVCFLHRW